MALGAGGPHERGGEIGHPPKRRYSTISTVNGSTNVKMFADRHRHAAYHNKLSSTGDELYRIVNTDDVD